MLIITAQSCQKANSTLGDKNGTLQIRWISVKHMERGPNIISGSTVAAHRGGQAVRASHRTLPHRGAYNTFRPTLPPTIRLHLK